ncbi:MAG: hypothetical protein JSV04_08335 [Candidatus Heimdallarchaeota archaeon]|nr:MAG: hypothetical protein JSV04_08335 [Candidatus Heimdallarchaeota archaeon]
MKASRVTVSTFGTILGIAGLEHGVGEILQGNKAPESIFIQSWPNNQLYEILNGEPAMTIIPNYILTGILAIIVSAVLIVWAILFIERKHGGLIFLLLSFIALLVGGGVAGPVLIGIIVGLTSTRIDTEFTWMNTHLSTRDSLSRIWKYSYSVSVIGWFSLWPGLIILGMFVPVIEPLIVIFLTLLSFTSMLLTIVSSFAYDSIKNNGFPENGLTTSA